jgi:hypothetical protein
MDDIEASASTSSQYRDGLEGAVCLESEPHYVLETGL